MSKFRMDLVEKWLLDPLEPSPYAMSYFPEGGGKLNESGGGGDGYGNGLYGSGGWDYGGVREDGYGSQLHAVSGQMGYGGTEGGGGMCGTGYEDGRWYGEMGGGSVNGFGQNVYGDEGVRGREGGGEGAVAMGGGGGGEGVVAVGVLEEGGGRVRGGKTQIIQTPQESHDLNWPQQELAKGETLVHHSEEKEEGKEDKDGEGRAGPTKRPVQLLATSDSFEGDFRFKVSFVKEGRVKVRGTRSSFSSSLPLSFLVIIIVTVISIAIINVIVTISIIIIIVER